MRNVTSLAFVLAACAIPACGQAPLEEPIAPATPAGGSSGVEEDAKQDALVGSSSITLAATRARWEASERPYFTVRVAVKKSDITNLNLDVSLVARDQASGALTYVYDWGDPRQYTTCWNDAGRYYCSYRLWTDDASFAVGNYDVLALVSGLPSCPSQQTLNGTCIADTTSIEVVPATAPLTQTIQVCASVSGKSCSGPLAPGADAVYHLAPGVRSYGVLATFSKPAASVSLSTTWFGQQIGNTASASNTTYVYQNLEALAPTTRFTTSLSVNGNPAGAVVVATY